MKILLGLSNTPEGASALDRAIEEARCHGSSLHIVHHVRVASRDDVTDTELANIRTALAEAESTAVARDVECEVEWTVGVGGAGRELLRLAERVDVDMIVIGTRRRSRVGKAVLGSDAQDVILGADVPVLAVKASPGVEDR